MALISITMFNLSGAFSANCSPSKNAELLNLLRELNVAGVSGSGCEKITADRTA